MLAGWRLDHEGGVDHGVREDKTSGVCSLAIGMQLSESYAIEVVVCARLAILLVRRSQAGSEVQNGKIGKNA
jgi:hypothetical protein